MTSAASPSPACPYIILGSGLAAILVARELLARHISADAIALCAPWHHARSSDVPGALMHPLPGTTLAPKPDTMLAYEHATRRILDWQQRYPEHVRASAMVRPDRGGRKGARFIKTYLKGQPHYHPSMTHDVVHRETLDAFVPGLHHDAQRAARYGPTYCVALGALLPLLRQDLLDLGVRQLPHMIDRLTQQHNGTWHLYEAEQLAPVARAQHVILAMGASLGQWFPDLEVHLNGGELAVLDAPSDRPLEDMISGGGHISPMPDCEPDAWVMGSTYLRPAEGKTEHDEDAFIREDEAAISQLREMIGTFYPPVHTAPVRRLWRGVRAVYAPDKHPLAGALPGCEGVLVLGALGSKGLLWGALLAHQLGELLLGDEAPIVSAPCDLRRAPIGAWQSPRITPFSHIRTSS